jgi:hypothetical protein
MIRCAAAAVIIPALMYALVKNLGTNTPVQDTAFMSGLLYLMLMCFRVVRVLGLFDLFSYGANRVMSSFKHTRTDDEKPESYADYIGKIERTVAVEPLIFAGFFWAVSIIARIIKII